MADSAGRMNRLHFDVDMKKLIGIAVLVFELCAGPIFALMSCQGHFWDQSLSGVFSRMSFREAGAQIGVAVERGWGEAPVVGIIRCHLHILRCALS